MEYVAAIMISAGILFFVGEVVGIHKFPDFYTRMHAAGKGDTLSTILIVGGFIVYSISQGDEAGNWNVLVKLALIAVFILVTSPTSTHALMKAGFDAGLKPVEKQKRYTSGNVRVEEDEKE